MKILVTGAKGFVGKNLVSNLLNIRDGKVKNAGITVSEVFEYDIDTPETELDGFCRECDFVFNLAGINRPENPEDFIKGNRDFGEKLLEKLEQNGNTCPVMVSSSVQAQLDNPYGISKKAGEEVLRNYGDRTGAKTLIYRFPNIFGKWCRPNYNSAVATFCNNIANDLPITVNNSATVLNLVYIDDVVDELINALNGNESRNGDFCFVKTVYSKSLGEITDLLYSFKKSREDLSVPDLSDGFTKKLHATYLSYLPKNEFSYNLKMNTDNRGSFTEILRTKQNGQFSVNISHPHITKGNHWHNTKNEKFLVVYGTGVIRFRKPDSDEIIQYFVSGSNMQVVDIPTGYTHNIENLGDTDMVTFMWCNECFDPDKPDTFFLEV